MNATEWRLWNGLRKRQIEGWRFRRQHPIGPYFVDFCCPAARLVIEVQGPAHDEESKWRADQGRFAWLEAQGYRVMRVIVEDVDEDLDGVMGSIYGALIEQAALLRVDPRPTSPRSGEVSGKAHRRG